MTKKNAGRGTGQRILERLQEKGVRIPCPESFEIGSDVSPDRISGDRVIFHGGCKIYGPKTLIMAGAELGYEAPVTVHNCQLGRDVKLKGGLFSDSTFLEGTTMGSGAQVRGGCILEEEARGAHAVGIKRTILFPYVTLGSLINFCDCLMAGGTDKKNHSEVGSSYIHFNFTPNQDKATASLIGDVPRGVMLNQPPVFLGGQGGLVGPVKVEFGSVIAAGTIVRKDVRRRNVMLFAQPSLSKGMPFHQGLYPNVKRIVILNTEYISNLIALRRWYLDMRSKFLKNDIMEQALHEGAVEKLNGAIEERIKRLGEVAKKMPRSIEIYKEVTGERFSEQTVRTKKEFLERWDDIESAFWEGLENYGDPSKREAFLRNAEESMKGKDYISAIKGLSQNEIHLGISWLQGLVDQISGSVWNLLPSLRISPSPSP
jgi:bifunctional UDP-N-acetylglucosamine pyrophosphorylase/glucosamine-1-phosphate N-acetyltransferase